ncbi:MAG TPA: hypothetical protein VF723_05420 [Pyrinomonadaceae bacterium]|jgi:hypothetical protein
MKYVLTLLGGLILGALLVLFWLGAPKAKALPGEAVKTPEPGGDAAGTALVTLDEQFFDALLGSVFRDIGAPSFPLELTKMERGLADGEAEIRLAADNCPDLVVLAPEGSNVKTSVRFADGKITAPLAFTGSYSILGSCVQFKGWAQASIQLSFDREKQTVYGQINVESVNLEGAPAAVGGIATLLVQRSLNQRINPMEILRAPQLALAMPVQASNGTLKAQVKDVRAEVANGRLNLHITYDFTGLKGQQPPPG